jgi:hypothetical protein
VFPTVETPSAQALAGLLVFGSYFTAQPLAGFKSKWWRPARWFEEKSGRRKKNAEAVICGIGTRVTGSSIPQRSNLICGMDAMYVREIPSEEATTRLRLWSDLPSQPELGTG